MEKAFTYRGMLVDNGRYFFDKKDIKQLIDDMENLELNVLHWHLTEDQGWRVEIFAYPLLTQIGSRRSHTNFNHKAHFGYYTKEDIKEIVDYAHSKNIKVMPEIDIPGHSVAAIAAYPHLSCFNRNLNVATHWGVKHDILCAGKDSTYEFYKTVFDEVAQMFPDKMIHLGGDEAPKTRWKLCPACQHKIKQLGLKDEDALQDYFMEYFANYLAKKGITTYRWANTKAEAENMKGSVPMFYGDSKNETINVKHIDASSYAYYFDLPYGYVPYQHTKEYTPDENAVGVECCLWGEYIPNLSKARKMLYPRGYAFSQMARFGRTLPSVYDSDKKANPSKIRGFFSRLIFEKRQLTWEGLTIIKDNKKVEKFAKSK